MAKYAVVLDTQDLNQKALLQIISNEGAENCVIPFDIPPHLHGEISVGTSIVETKEKFEDGEEVFVSTCSPIRPISFSSSNNLRIRTLINLKLNKINQMTSITTNVAYSKEFGAIKVPTALIPKLKQIKTSQIYADIELNNRQDCWFSNFVKWQLAENGILLEIASYEAEKEPPFRIDESSLYFGPFQGVVVDTTPGAALIWSPKIVAVLHTETITRPGMWYNFQAKMSDSNHEFPIPCKYSAHKSELTEMPVLPTIVSNETSCGISFEIEGIISMDEKEKFYFLKTSELGDISNGITSCLIGGKLAVGEKVVAQVILSKDDVNLVLSIRKIDKIAESDVGVCVSVSSANLQVSIGTSLYNVESHVRQFCEFLRAGHIVQVKFCYNRSKSEKRIFSYRIIDKESIIVSGCSIKGEFLVQPNGVVILMDQKYNCFVSEGGLVFIDFENTLVNHKQQRVMIEWSNSSSFPHWKIKNVTSETRSVPEPEDTKWKSTGHINPLIVSPKSEKIERPSPIANSSLKNILVNKQCFCSPAVFQLLSRSSPNNLVENETPYKLKLLAVEQHSHGDLMVVQFFVSSVSWVGSTFCTVVFGPNYEQSPRHLSVGQWFEKNLQRVKNAGGNKRIVRVKYGEEWRYPTFIPAEPSIMKVLKNDKFSFVSCSTQLLRKNDKEDCCGIHTILYSKLFGVVIANGEDHFCDPFDDNVEEIHYSGFVEPLSGPLKLGKFLVLWKVTRTLEILKVIPRTAIKDGMCPKERWEAHDHLTLDRLVDSEQVRNSAQEKEKKRKEKRMKEKYKEMDRVSKQERIDSLQSCFDIIQENYLVLSAVNEDIFGKLETAKLGFSDKLKKKSQRIVIGAKFLYDVLSDRDYYVALQLSTFDDLRTLRSTLREFYSYLVNLPGADIASIQSFIADL